MNEKTTFYTEDKHPGDGIITSRPDGWAKPDHNIEAGDGGSLI